MTDPSLPPEAALAGLYARVSRPMGQYVGTQVDRLRELARSLRLDLPEERVFVDDGVSGRGTERPAFERLRAAVRGRSLSVVLATKLDRLGRSAKGILEFFDEAGAHGVRVIIADQQIDTSTPVGRLVRTVLAAMAELEADLIAERTREAMAALKSGARSTRSGRPIGRPRRLTAQVVERIREERAKGLKWSVVAQHVGIPTGTCRKVGSAPRSETPRAENPLPGFGTQSGRA